MVATFSLLTLDTSAALAQPDAAQTPADQGAEHKTPGAGETFQRSDSFSAHTSAREFGEPVEDLSQRTESTLIKAMPDGSWSMESYGVPKFRQNEAGEWLPIEEATTFDEESAALVGPDTTLEVARGDASSDAGVDGVAPLATLTDTSGDAEERFVLGWEGELPVPVLDGSTATFTEDVSVPVTADAEDGAVGPGTGPAPAPAPGPRAEVIGAASAEVRVEATRTGFSHFVTLDEAPEGDVTLRFPLELSEGLTAAINDAGTIEIRDAEGELSFYAPKPLMWDAAVNEQSGLPEHETQVDAELVEEDGQQVLVLPVSGEWLQDAEREYPVTIDPTWSTPVSADTWVQSDYTGVNGGSPELRSGTYNNGGVIARSLIQFPTAALNGKQILSADLQINSYHSWSCTATTTYAQRVTSAWNPATATWSNQPTATTVGQGGYTGAKGFSSACAAGDVLFPVTGIVQHWADTPASNYGFRLVAGNEGDSFGWRRYRSSSYLAGDNAAEPHLRVNYNSYPNTPTSWSMATGHGAQYKDPATGVTTTYARVTRPQISGIVSDPDGGSVRLGVDVFEGSTLLWDKARSDFVASGARATSTPPSTPELVNGKTYTAKLWSGDGNVFSKTSQNFNFVVDTAAPGAPSVAASAVANNGSTTTKPANNTFTFTSSAADTVKFQYSQDGAAFVDLAATGSTTKTATLTWLPEGAHELRVKAVDKATNESAISTFKFTFGDAADVSTFPPAAGANGVASGERGAASMVGRDLNDAQRSSWNPTNGNVLLTGRLLNLGGLDQDLNIGWRYNSLNDARPTLNVGRTETALRVDTATGNVTYTAPDGAWHTFKPAAVAGTWTQPAGLNASLTKPSADKYEVRFNDSGVVNTYTNDGTYFSLTQSRDAGKNQPKMISYAYANGLLSSITDTQGRRVTFEYADKLNLGQPSKITDTSLNRSMNLVYGGGTGRLSKITDATGAVTTLAYNTAGKLITLTDTRQATSYEYDASGRVSKILYASGSPVQSVFTPAYVNATTTTLTDPNNNTATYTFNTARQVTSTKDANGNIISGTFDGFDNRMTSTDGLANTTTAKYNANNSLTNITSPAGTAGGTGGDSSLTYNSAAGDPFSNYQPATSTDSENNVTEITYETNYNKPSVVTTAPGTPDETITRNFYHGDSNGVTCGLDVKPGALCRSQDGNGNTTTYSYDPNGNLIEILRPAPLGTVRYTYDGAGRVATMKDGKSQTATYTYDANDRLTQVRYESTCEPATCVTFTYDGSGNLTQRVDASGTTTYTYDQQNRSTAKNVPGGSTELTYDGASNVLTAVDATGTTSYRYDPANRLVALAEPGGSCPATPTFPNSTKCVGFGYDKNNRRTTTTYPNGVKNTTVFDNAGRITETRANNTAGAILTKRAYTYTAGATNKDGSLRKTVTTEANATTTYGYDKLNRLTTAALGGTTETWAYDKNGNRTSAAKTGAPTQYSVYNAADQLCWTSTTNGTCSTVPAGAKTYGYDANGNTTKAGANTASFNTFDQLASSTFSGTTNNYTYAGLRNDERTSAGVTKYINGSLGVTTRIVDRFVSSFIRDPEGTLISMRTATGESLYYTTDALGSVILLTDSNQAKAATYSYDSWGNTTASGGYADTNPYQYVSGEYDSSTGLTKFGARYYDPAIGRFTQRDPSGQDPHYSYAGNNPITRSDTTGLSSFGQEVLGDAIGGLVGTVATFGIGLLSKTPAGIGASVAVGCIGGGIGEAISSGEGSGFGRGCLKGSITGGLTGGAGYLLKNAFPKR